MAIRKRVTHSAIDMRDQRDDAVILWDVQAVDVLDEPVERPTTLIEDSVQLYLREIGSVALLNSEEEVTFAKAIEKGLEAKERLQQEHTLSWNDRIACERTYMAGEDARRQLIQANLRLVVSIAKKYANGPLSLMDLVQEGNIGLMRAVEKFDYTKGHRFLYLCNLVDSSGNYTRPGRAEPRYSAARPYERFAEPATPYCSSPGANPWSRAYRC